MKGIRQAFLVFGATIALILVALISYFVISHPSIISLLTLVVSAPMFLIIGLGFLKAARNSNQPPTKTPPDGGARSRRNAGITSNQ
jgi:hypothetical protein